MTHYLIRSIMISLILYQFSQQGTCITSSGRHLNHFLWKESSKYEDLRTAMLLFEKGDMASPLILNLVIIM